MHKLYTLGYTGLKPAQLVDVMKRLDATIIDTRYSPRSQVAHWQGTALAQLLGTGYVHMPELGNVNYKTGGPIKIYSPNIGTQQVIGVLDKRPAILLCACPDWHTCHRRVVADMVREACGCEVVHLEKVDLAGDAPKDDKPTQRELF